METSWVNTSTAITWGLPHDKSFLRTAAERALTFWYIAIPYDVDGVASTKDIIGDAVPVFLFLMTIEFIYGKVVLGRTLYSFGDTLGSIYSGITQQWFSALLRFLTFPLYAKLYRHRLTSELGAISTCALWFATAIAVEFTYYWMHRWSHEYQLLWSSHRVHHSGERYNLATALRQGAYQPLASFLISTAPLALLGFPPRMYALHAAMNTVSQFWFHTECIRRVPCGLELILNTPAHHRRHHLYPGNCNYGGFLIVFDRLFGTFEGEPEQSGPTQGYDPNYGVAEQMDTFNGVEMNLRGLWRLRRIARHSKAGLFARRWDSRAGSGNFTGTHVPPLRRPLFEGYSGDVRRGGGSRVALLWRQTAALALGVFSLGLQLVCKQRSLGETALCAAVGLGCIYVGGMCLDGPKKAKHDE